MDEMHQYPPWVIPFLEHLRTSCNVAESCRAVDVPSARAYALRRSNDDFAAAWDNALEDAYDVLEAEARRRAFEGYDEPVHYQGERVDTVRKYSDSLAKFLLAGYRKKFATSRTEVTGADGAAVEINDAERVARIEQIMAAAAARQQAAEDNGDLA